MSGLQPPLPSQDLGRCLTLPAAVCRLIVVIGAICSSVWRAMSVVRTPDALVLDVESCNQLAGCPGYGLNHTRPRARLGVRAIRWAIRQLHFEGATITGLARQLATTRNTVWSHAKPCLQAASDDPARFAGVRVLRVDERRAAPPGPTPTRPVSSPAS